MAVDALLELVLRIEAGALAGMVVGILGHGVWLRQARRWNDRQLAEGRRLMALTVDDDPSNDPESLVALWLMPKRLLIKLFMEFISSLQGEKKAQLAWLAEELGLTRGAEADCRSRVWWQRLRGVRLLTLLGSGRDAVPPLLADPHPLVRAQAADWAAEHATPEVIQALLRLLADEVGLCRFAVQDALLRAGGVAVEPLAAYLEAQAGPAAEAGLPVAEGLGDPRFLGPARRLCRDASPRVRARAAKLLGALGGEASAELLSELMADRTDEVRAAAAKAMGKLGHWPAAKSLQVMMRDPAWVVRRDAALALKALGAPGQLYLRQALASEDRFARDMAQQVLDLPAEGAR